MALAYQAWREQRNADAEQFCRAAIQASPLAHAAFNLLGVLAGQRSEHSDAVSYFAKALELLPTAEDYRKNLVRALLGGNRFSEAEACIRVGIEQDTSNAEFWRLLAYLCVKQEDFQQACGCYDRAIQIEPTEANNYFGKSEIYRLQGQYESAIACAEKALALAPGNTASLNNLAGLQLAHGDFTAALLSVKRLLDMDPRSAQAYCNLASLLSVAGDEFQAVVALRNALLLDPSLYRAKYLLASMLINIGGLDEAEAILRDLIERGHSDSAPCKVALARILERKGNLVEAEKLLSTLAPKLQSYPEVAIVRAVLLEQRGEDERAVQVLEEAVHEYPTIAVDGIGIQFMLGSLHDKLGDYESAFHAYERGNLNRKKALVQLETSDGTGETMGEKMLRLFDIENYSRCPSTGLLTEIPTFIVGMPRSGTTLVEQMLASHPRVHGGGELNFLKELIGETYAGSAHSSAFEILSADRFSGEQYTVPQGWGNIRVERMAELANQYLEKLQALSPAADRITDKLPYHFSMVPLIHRLFPRARIIHCVRHPLDTCLSCYFQNFASGNQFSYELASLGQYYLDYWKIMEVWKHNLKIPMLEVKYEEIIESPEQTVRRLLDYAGLEWNDACLEFHRSKRVVHTASYQQVRKPLYRTSIGKWKNYTEHLQPLIKILGELADHT